MPGAEEVGTAAGASAEPWGKAALDAVVSGIGVLQWEEALPAFGSCAFVGREASLVGKGLGAEIDLHDTVIRSDRLPNGAHRRDFGGRTDVLLAGPDVLQGCAGYGLRYLMSRLGPAPPSDAPPVMDGASDAPFSCAANASCGFGVLVLLAAPAGPPGAPGGCRWPRPQGVLRPAVAQLAAGLLGHAAPPSPQLQALAAFAPVCRSLRVYGLGEGSAGEAPAHDFEAERRAVDGLCDPAAGAAPRGAAGRGPGGEEERWLRARLAEAARRGALAVEEAGAPYRRARLRDVVSNYTGDDDTLPLPMKRCALVGGSSILHDRGLGPEIDAHDTVIRVNRLPTPAFFADWGRRTDIYFAEPDFFRYSLQTKQMGLRSATRGF
ncbi:unnamed protein product, partial [Prorocentrum cordatum]